jgi:hypothetical protein
MFYSFSVKKPLGIGRRRRGTGRSRSGRSRVVVRIHYSINPIWYPSRELLLVASVAGKRPNRWPDEVQPDTVKDKKYLSFPFPSLQMVVVEVW